MTSPRPGPQSTSPANPLDPASGEILPDPISQRTARDRAMVLCGEETPPRLRSQSTAAANGLHLSGEETSPRPRSNFPSAANALHFVAEQTPPRRRSNFPSPASELYIGRDAKFMDPRVQVCDHDPPFHSCSDPARACTPAASWYSAMARWRGSGCKAHRSRGRSPCSCRCSQDALAPHRHPPA